MACTCGPGQGCQPPKPGCWGYPTTSVPIFTIPSTPLGCICPAGANRDCENPTCPRKDNSKGVKA